MARKRSWLDWLLQRKPIMIDRTLDVMIDGKRVTVTVTRACGMMLIAETPGGEWMIRQQEAVDPRRYLALWKQLDGGAGMIWADGTPYNE